MNEIRIRKTGSGSCDECGKVRKGVAFEIGAVCRPGESFLCWEHFRLLLGAMKPGRTVIEERVTVRNCSCHCRHTCCRPCCVHSCAFGRGERVGFSETHSESVGPGRGECVSTGRTLTRSFGTSRGLSSAG